MNKKFLVSLLMIATIFSCIGLSGCKKTKPTTAPPKQEQVEKQEKEQKQVNKQKFSKKINEAKKFETKEETICYRTLGEKNDKKVYYTMNMPQAREVTKFLFNYVKMGGNINYKTVKGNNQYEYYSQNLKKQYGSKEDCNQGSIACQKKMEIIQSFLGFEHYNFINFNKDFTTCKVSVNRLIKFNHLSPTTKLSKSGVKINTPYSQEVTYNLIQENGNWKVDSEKFDLNFYIYSPNKSQ